MVKQRPAIVALNMRDEFPRLRSARLECCWNKALCQASRLRADVFETSMKVQAQVRRGIVKNGCQRHGGQLKANSPTKSE